MFKSYKGYVKYIGRTLDEISKNGEEIVSTSVYVKSPDKHPIEHFLIITKPGGAFAAFDLEIPAVDTPWY